MTHQPVPICSTSCFPFNDDKLDSKTFYIENHFENRVDFNGEVLTFSIQLNKI